MNDHQANTINTYHRLMNANAMSRTYLLARKLGVFDKLKEGQRGASQLSSELDLACRPLELLLDQLCETGYVEKYGSDYALSVLGKMLPFEWSDLGGRYWDCLEVWLREGKRIEGAEIDFDKTEFGHESRAFEWMATPNALDLIEILNIGRGRKGMKLVELGCGSAVFSSAMGYHDSEMRVCLVDSDENLVRAKSTTDSVAISNRCEFVAADPVVFDSTFNADLILMANNLWRYDDAELGQMLENASSQLNKQGEIVIVDEFCESGDARFSFQNNGLLTELRTPKGRLRSKKDITEMLYKHGFVDAMYSDLKSPPGTRGVIVAGITKV